jgi:hypothetical protein
VRRMAISCSTSAFGRGRSPPKCRCSASRSFGTWASLWFGMRGDARRNERSRGRGLAACASSRSPGLEVVGGAAVGWWPLVWAGSPATTRHDGRACRRAVKVGAFGPRFARR